MSAIAAKRQPMKHLLVPLGLMALATVIGIGITATAKNAEPDVVLTQDGAKLEAEYTNLLTALRAEVSNALPLLPEQEKAALQKARASVKAAQRQADSAHESSSEAKNIEAKIANWRRFWIRGAEKNITKSQADLQAAATDADRDTARKEIAKWQANKADGEKAINQALADLDLAKASESERGKSNVTAQAALAQARGDELSAAKTLLADAEPFVSSDKMDAKLARCAVLVQATPRGLAAFAQQGSKQKALVDSLLSDEKLVQEMLIAGGANRGKYGRAMEIYTAIQQASTKAGEGVLHRLALATSLEYAVPIKQNNAQDQTREPATVDPVKRYLHYEKAYLNGELDPAFGHLGIWELRMVVDCDAPDEILAWGREMLRNYRPDHILNPDYGWRYSATVRTDVRYGSQDGKDDLPSLNSYQNIIKDGGVCGRRAFFGRFILRAFGIPVWGVTQHKHAALSHWTPKGWVVNLGAGFNASWWDKDEVPLSGADFLLEAQARVHANEYMAVLRAQWISRVLGETAYDGRKNVDGGIWSSLGHYQTALLASQAVTLKPLGEELAEANEPQEVQSVEHATVTKADQQIAIGQDGKITIPAVSHGSATGKAAAMKSFSGGMQLLGSGGWKTEYLFEVPQTGRYALSAQVATVQEGQKFLFAANNAQSPIEIAVPYTVGAWQSTPPVEVQLVKGRNTLNFSIRDGSRNVAIKAFTLTPVK